jgi:D-beta-D-heptose 7-phosphate kinase/D-beta-D-heptose 1-phosphate adenosyltransferase
MSLVRAKSEPLHFRAEAKEVFDVSGAGDTVIAVLAASLGAGASLPEAVELSNIAAGIVVGKVGTAVVYPSDLIHALHHQELSHAETKVVDVKMAFDRIDLWRRKGLRIGFTNGFFELIQPGHISLLTQASKRCDRLIVGLNGDASVKRLKGKEPVLPESARSTILASLEAVDLVIVFQEDTPLHLLDALRPDVLIKGSNYKSHEVTGADFVMSYGGEVVIANIPDIHQNNSTLVQVTGGTL